MNPTIQAIVQLGGSANINEIYQKVIENLNLSDEIINQQHKNLAHFWVISSQYEIHVLFRYNFLFVIHKSKMHWKQYQVPNLLIFSKSLMHQH